MKYSQTIRPISYLKAHASEIIRDITENQETLIITQNGEAKVVVQDIHTFEKTQDSLALLKILALSTANIQKGKYQTAQKSFEDIRNKINDRKK